MKRPPEPSLFGAPAPIQGSLNLNTSGEAARAIGAALPHLSAAELALDHACEHVRQARASATGRTECELANARTVLEAATVAVRNASAILRAAETGNPAGREEAG